MIRVSLYLFRNLVTLFNDSDSSIHSDLLRVPVCRGRARAHVALESRLRLVPRPSCEVPPALGDHPHMTFALSSDFVISPIPPSPLSTFLNYFHSKIQATSFTPSAFWGPPPTADVICEWSLGARRPGDDVDGVQLGPLLHAAGFSMRAVRQLGLGHDQEAHGAPSEIMGSFVSMVSTKNIL